MTIQGTIYLCLSNFVKKKYIDYYASQMAGFIHFNVDTTGIEFISSQNANTRMGLFLILLTVVLQIIGFSLPTLIDDLSGVNEKGLLIGVSFSFCVGILSWIIRCKMHKGLASQIASEVHFLRSEKDRKKIKTDSY